MGSQEKTFQYALCPDHLEIVAEVAFFLAHNGIWVGKKGVYDAITRADVPKALRLIWTRPDRPDWIDAFRSDLMNYGVATEMEIKTACRELVHW